MFCTDVNLPPLDHTCFPTQERGNEKSVACLGRGGAPVKVEDARSLTQSGEVLWAAPQPEDCGKSAWVPGPSPSGAPVRGLFKQVCSLHGTACFPLPRFLLSVRCRRRLLHRMEPGPGGWTLSSQLWLPYHFLPVLSSGSPQLHPPRMPGPCSPAFLLPFLSPASGCPAKSLCFLRALQPGSAAA